MMNTEKKESKFVTRLGWVFFGFSLYSAAASVAQSILFIYSPPAELLGRFPTHINIMELIPPAFIFFFDHIHVFSAVSFVFSIAAVVASRAFLKRRDWARIFFAVVIALTAIFSLAGFFFLDAFKFRIPAGINLRQGMAQMNRFLDIYIIAMILLIVVFHGWLTYKLLSKDIKSEFTPCHY